MTSTKARLHRDNGPSWNSVAIHWTDSDMKRLEPVSGLPWIRTADKSKLFNKNGPLRVVAAYRTNDGVDPQLEYRHVSMIADAIEQYVLVTIRLPKGVPPSPGAEWPKFRIWAFLQPPIIGRDRKRRDANGGFVVDDIPRAGWFEAVVDGKTMTAEEIDYSKGHTSPPGKRPIKVAGERDGTDPRVVRFKICARVANNESEAELKEKAKKLRKKNQDVSLMEAGSYLKVWVRNEERSWKVNPLDDDSERIVRALAESDRIRPVGGRDPRCFRNHTWKRSRLATHKSIVRGAKPEDRDRYLLYVGLYPAHVTKKIEEFETKLQETSGHPLAWLTTVIAWTLLAQGAKALRTKVASKRPHQGAVGNESPHMKTTKQIAELFKSAQLSDLFASYAVAGYGTFKDVMTTMNEAQVHHEPWYGRTKTLLEMILKASLLSDAKSRDHHAMQQMLEEIEKQLGPKREKSFKDSISKQMLGWSKNWKDNSFSATVSLLEEKVDKTIPAVPTPLPLPFLQWLSWYVKLSAEAGLMLTFSVSNSKANELELKASITGKGKATAKVGLQGIWARMGDAASEKMSKDKPGPEGELLQKIVQLVNLELSLKAEISPEAIAELSAKFVAAGNREDGWKMNLKADFGCPLEFNLSLFSWSYNTFNGKVWDLGNSGGSFFKDVVAFGEKKDWETTVSWGKSNYDDLCYITSNRTDLRLFAALGAVIPLSLKYRQASNPEKSTAALSLVSDTILELGSSIPVRNRAPGSTDPEGEITTPLRLTWNPAAGKGAGVISLFGLYASKWDKMEKAFQELKKKERELDLSITTPDSDRPTKLSDKSRVVLLSPKVKCTGARSVLQPRAGLEFEFDLVAYMDSHIWVKLCEEDLGFDDVCTLKGIGKNNWRLYPLQGKPGMQTKRKLFIPGPDIRWAGTGESSYKFYLKLALLDSDDCELDQDRWFYLTVPHTTLTALHKG